jgi:hypothetical protein
MNFLEKIKVLLYVLVSYESVHVEIKKKCKKPYCAVKLEMIKNIR